MKLNYCYVPLVTALVLWLVHLDNAVLAQAPTALTYVQEPVWIIQEEFGYLYPTLTYLKGFITYDFKPFLEGSDGLRRMLLKMKEAIHEHYDNNVLKNTRDYPAHFVKRLLDDRNTRMSRISLLVKQIDNLEAEFLDLWNQFPVQEVRQMSSPYRGRSKRFLNALGILTSFMPLFFGGADNSKEEELQKQLTAENNRLAKKAIEVSNENFVEIGKLNAYMEFDQLANTFNGLFSEDMFAAAEHDYHLLFRLYEKSRDIARTALVERLDLSMLTSNQTRNVFESLQTMAANMDSDLLITKPTDIFMLKASFFTHATGNICT